MQIVTEVVKVKLTTIQIREETRKRLEVKKSYPKESYDAILRRMLEAEEIPSMEEMFGKADSMKQKRKYTTEEVVRLTHELRGKR